MPPKPEACRTCVLADDMLGYCPDEIIEEAEVYVYGQGPGKDEESEGIPYTGRSGEILNNRFLPLAGLQRGENVSIGNTIRCRWRDPATGLKTDKLPPEPILSQAIRHCTRAHRRISRNTRLVVAQGQVAWTALGGRGNIHNWRGYLLQGQGECGGETLPPVRTLPEHPVLQAAGHVVQDVPGVDAPGRGESDRISGKGESGQAQPAPGVPQIPVLGTIHIAAINREYKLYVPSMSDWAKIPRFLAGTWPVPFPTIHQIHEVNWNTVEHFFSELHTQKSRLVIDTEYFKENHLVWLIGLYFMGAPFVLQAQWLSDEVQTWQRIELAKLIRQAAAAHPVLMQNALADVRALRRTLEMDWHDYKHVDDTMQAHSILYTEYDHDLGFLDSVFGPHNKVKHLFKENPTLYNAGDCWTPPYAMAAFEKEFETDKASRQIYKEHLELLPIIDESMSRGIAINGPAVREGIEKYEKRKKAAQDTAQRYCGYPINVTSNDQVAKWLYEIEGLPVKKKKGRRGESDVEGSVGKDAVGDLRKIFLGFDPDDEPTDEYLDRRIALGGHPLLESRFVNQSAGQNLSHYLYPLLNKDRTVLDRVYHSIAIHTQDNARWSYTRPPLAQTPKDLLYIYEPDFDYPWFIWDWDQIELRQVAGVARDMDLLRQFEEGLDVHLIACCDVFGLSKPPVLRNPFHSSENAGWLEVNRWLRCDHEKEICGKGDPRRVFGKNFQYRECFSLEASPSSAMDMPSARALGLTESDMVRADTNWKLAHPAIVQWKRHHVEKGKETRTSRTWHGRLRRFTDHLDNLSDQILDHPSQAGTQDIANLVILDIKRRFKDAVYYVYGRHDSQIWAIHRTFFDEISPQIKEIAQQPRDIFGIKIPFPASFDERRRAA